MLDVTAAASLPELYRDWGNSSVLKHPSSRHHKIIVLSDLHFPRPDSHPKYVLEFLKYNTCDVLIFLGDTHEGYDTELAPFKELHLRVWDLIEERKSQGMTMIDIPGNHDAYKRTDAVLKHRILGTEYWSHLAIESNQGRTFLSHGDSLDDIFLQKNDHRIYRAARNFAFRGTSLVDIWSNLECRWNRWRGGPDVKANGAALEAAAAKEARRYGCSAVLNGHTHNPSRFLPVEKHPDVLYGNTGAWVGGQGTAMVLNSQNDWEMIDWRIERQQWMKGKPEGLTASNDYAHQRAVSEEDFRLQHTLHAHYIWQKEVSSTRSLIENMVKVKKTVEDILRAAEEKLKLAEDALHETGHKVDEMMKTHPVAPLTVPAGESRNLHPV